MIESQQELRRRVAEHLRAHPNAMTLAMAREWSMPEVEIVRHLPHDRSRELDIERFEAVMERCRAVDPVHVIVSNAAATMECTGQLGGFSRTGDYFNIQSPTIDMHIHIGRLAAAFAVEKPSHITGVPTLSIQFFDRTGNSAFKVFFTFGQKQPSEEIRGVWDDICRSFALTEGEAV